ncbi:hypothetical protein OHC33_005821 [Knufia fluminis]|uniref:Uncharacterized protein n=1 Tax=Knufia fluminis TaxID=191047 RepID=A0AAN8EDZ3_9EURO|nr:hypothetical protein OHC33_005821 [Knufia fluminis]
MDHMMPVQLPTSRPQLIWLIISGSTAGLTVQFAQSIRERGDIAIVVGAGEEHRAGLQDAGAFLLTTTWYLEYGLIDHLYVVEQAIKFRGRVDVVLHQESSVRLGIAESLHTETSHLGIKTILIEPGQFGVDLFQDGYLQAFLGSPLSENARWPSQSLPQYLHALRQVSAGDGTKLVEVVLDLVREEGVAASRNTLFRLPLGTDAFNIIKAKCQETLKLLKEWEDVIKSTDIDSSAHTALRINALHRCRP